MGSWSGCPWRPTGGWDLPGAGGARLGLGRSRTLLGLPAALWDETLTTAEVHELLIEADVSRKRRAAVVDRMAAARILQSALDSRG